MLIELSRDNTSQQRVRGLRLPVRRGSHGGTMKEKQTAVSSSTGQMLMEMYDLLYARFGPQNWWPARGELEVMVGAVLTQNTNWKNVEKAIDNLEQEGLLSLEGLWSLDVKELAQYIKSAGYFNIKAKRLMNLVAFIFDKYEGDLSLLLGDTTNNLREGLLSVNGIGPETADSILLYAAGRPVFVIDAYTYRILKRHGMVEDEVDYYEMQELFMDHLPEDPELFNEFHALIVCAGKHFCRRNPLCDLCPLEDWDSPLQPGDREGEDG